MEEPSPQKLLNSNQFELGFCYRFLRPRLLLALLLLPRLPALLVSAVKPAAKYSTKDMWCEGAPAIESAMPPMAFASGIMVVHPSALLASASPPLLGSLREISSSTTMVPRIE